MINKLTTSHSVAIEKEFAIAQPAQLGTASVERGRRKPQAITFKRIDRKIASESHQLKVENPRKLFFTVCNAAPRPLKKGGKSGKRREKARNRAFFERLHRKALAISDFCNGHPKNLGGHRNSAPPLRDSQDKCRQRPFEFQMVQLASRPMSRNNLPLTDEYMFTTSCWQRKKFLKF